MEFGTRWVKIVKDIWSHKTRTLLVVMSIAVGVAAVGMVTNSLRIMRRGLGDPYLAGNPGSVTIYVSPFQDGLAEAAEAIPGVSEVDARQVFLAQVKAPGSGEFVDIQLNGIDDFTRIDVNRFAVEAGATDPGLRGILLERQSAKRLGAEIGDPLIIEIRDDEVYTVYVTGIVHDLNKVPPVFTEVEYGYLSLETLVWMGETAAFNQIDVALEENRSDREHVTQITSDIRERVIEPAGLRVLNVNASQFGNAPGQHWAYRQVEGLAIVLNVMGFMCIVLSGGLVINTITAILTQQVKQIGIMRSVGGLRGQISAMYVVNVLVYSLLALLVAIPLGLIGAWALVIFVADLLNYTPGPIDLPLNLFLLQAILAVVVPVFAALYPIIAGTSISVYNAIYQHGLTGEAGEGALERLLNQIRTLGRPVILAFRNTFRRKARLAFTLITLTLAGSTYIAVFSTQESLNQKIQDIARYWVFDASMSVTPGASRHTVIREALRVQGVMVAEGWASGSGAIVRPDGSETEAFEIYAPPTDSITVEPLMLAGRWLEPGDTSVIVVNEDFLDDEPDIRVGDRVTVRIGYRERPFEVIGIASRHLLGTRIYMPYATYTRIVNQPTQINFVRVRASEVDVSSRAVQFDIAARLDDQLKTLELGIGQSETRVESLDQLTGNFGVILQFLLIMAALLAIVGGLGLAGTMSINVMERTREIGVMRAVGASNESIRQVVIVEGLAVGIISWLCGLVLAFPLGIGLANAVGNATVRSDLNFTFSLFGAVSWLVLVLIIAAAASLAPARSAVQLTVREVLDYE